MGAKTQTGNKKYELVAPDGGWGYMICVSSVIVLVAATAFIQCFGMIYNEFMLQIGMGSTSVSIVNGIAAISTAISGFFTRPLLNIMSQRHLALASAIIYNSGIFGMFLVNSEWSFYLCHGMLQGIGVGMLFNLTFTLMNEYFSVKRLFSMSIVQTIIAAFSMAVPQLIKYSLNYCGYRGTLLVVSAVTIQIFVAVALMQPVAWHMKRVEVPDKEEFYLLMDEEKGKILVPATVQKDLQSASMENKSQDQDCYVTNNTQKLSIRKMFDEIFDVTTVKILLASNVSWGLSLATFADMMFTILIPQALYAIGWKEDTVALALSLAGFGDLAARGSFIFFSKYLNKIGNQELFIIGLVVSSIAKIGMLCSSLVTVVLLFITLIGVARSFVALFLPLVLADVVGGQRFTSAVGIIMVMMGFINLGLGPVVGAVRDYTDNYYITFAIITAVTAGCAVSWTIELIYKKHLRSTRGKTKL